MYDIKINAIFSPLYLSFDLSIAGLGLTTTITLKMQED